MTVRSVENAIARVDKQISVQQRTLARAQYRIPKLAAQKEGLLKIKEKYPDVKFVDGGAIYLPTMDWNNIAGVSIDRKWNRVAGGNATTYSIKFSLNKKQSGGVKVYMVPAEGKIAETGYAKTIKIFDYKGIIPETCPKRKVLIKHIKKQLLKLIRYRKLTITNDSFDKEDFLKLMLLT